MNLFWQPVRIATGSGEEGMLVFADGPCFSAYQQGRCGCGSREHAAPQGAASARVRLRSWRVPKRVHCLCVPKRTVRKAAALPGSRSKADPYGENRQPEAKALPPESFSVLPP